MKSPARKQHMHTRRVERKASKRRAEIKARHAGKLTRPKKQDPMHRLYQRYVNTAKLLPLTYLLGERKIA